MYHFSSILFISFSSTLSFPFSFETNERGSWINEREFHELGTRTRFLLWNYLLSKRREGSGFEEETRKGIGAPLLLYGKLAYNNNKVVVGRWRVISDNLCFEQKFSFTWVVSWKRDLDRISFRQGVFPRERMEAIKERALSPPSFIIPPKKKILIMTNPLLALVQYLNDNILYPRWSVSPRLCDSQRLNILLSPMSILLRINI